MMHGEKNFGVNEFAAIKESFHQRVDDSKRKKTVCVHFLKKQCKKGDNCEFLHVLLEDKIPLCKYYQQDREC